MSHAFGFGEQAISLDPSKAFSPKVHRLEHSAELLGWSWHPKWTNTFHSLPGKCCRAGRNPVLMWGGSSFCFHSWSAVCWQLAQCLRWSQTLQPGYGPQPSTRVTLVSGVCLSLWVTAHARTLFRLWVRWMQDGFVHTDTHVACIFFKLLFRTCLRRKRISFPGLFSWLRAQTECRFTPSWVCVAAYVVLTKCATSSSTL